MDQLFQEHGFVGGTAPYGYRLCRLGRSNKRGHELYDLAIDPAASQTVKKIFDLYCIGKEGTHRIAAQLNADGQRTKRGALWNSAGIRNVLQNPICTGVRKREDLQTNCFEHLRIIEDNLFLIAQDRLEKSKSGASDRGCTMHREKVLLPGSIFCMHCGKRMTVTRNMKTRIKKDGSKVTYDRLKYICINKSSLHPCDGQRSYSTKMVDTAVLKLLQEVLLSEGSSMPVQEISSVKTQYEQLKLKISQERASLETLKAEVVQVLQGVSAFGSVLIRDLIQQSETKLIAFEQELAAMRERLQQSKEQKHRVSELRSALLSSDVKDLDALPFHLQREIAEILISRIELGRGGAVQIEWSCGGTAFLPPNAGG